MHQIGDLKLPGVFNVPVWSVSIEVPIYFLFFSLLFFIRKFKYLTALFIIFFVYFIFSPLVGLLNSGDLNGSFQLMALMNFSWCIFYFFIGSFIFFFYSKFRKYQKILLISSFMSIITCIVFINLDFTIVNAVPFKKLQLKRRDYEKKVDMQS